MHAVHICGLLVLCVTHIYSVTISTPAMQRKAPGESCKFRWSVTGNFTTYSIKLLSSAATALGPNTNQTVDYSSGLITLFIRNIQTSDAGYYQLSINTGTSTDITSIVLLFVYSNIYAYANMTIGRNPGFEGDRIELNCTVTSYSLPAGDRPRLYYFWYKTWYGNVRNISSGPAVLQNGDVLPGYSIKNDGKTFVIASAQPLDVGFSCSVQEECSPYKSNNYNYLPITIYGKPITAGFSPASRRFNVAPDVSEELNIYFSYLATPPLISYTNVTFTNSSGNTAEFSNGFNPLLSPYAYLTFYFYSVKQYGSYSITITNSNGSKTETCQVLAPGPPDTPTNLSVQYMTSDFVSLQWRCMWFNGAQQTISIQLTNVATNAEVEIKNILLIDTTAYDFRYSTLFRKDIKPETSYVASIWSTNSLGSSSVVNLTFMTPKRLTLSVSSASILIAENEVTINFFILNSNTTVIRLNVTCCVEVTTECSNISYILANTDTQVVYDRLPLGSDYVFDLNVFDTDGYTYEYNLAIVKGLRVSRSLTADQTTIPYASNVNSAVDEDNPLFVPVIVLAVLLGVAVLVLISCCIVFLVIKCCQNKSKQLQANSHTSAPTRYLPDVRESYSNDNYEPVLEMDHSNNNAYYKSLGGTHGNTEQSSDARHTMQPEPEGDYDSRQNPYMNPDEIFYTNTGSGTLDRPKKNRSK